VVSGADVAAYAIASFVIIVIPGPSVLFVVGRALAYGRRAALASAVGNDAGTFVLATAVALGIGSLVERSLVIFTAMKLAGAACLVFLGVRALLQRGARGPLEEGTASRGGWRAGLDGFLVGVTNPKTVVFLAAVLPQFADPSRGHLAVQMFILGVVFTLIALTSDAVWSLTAGTARAWFSRSPQRLRIVGGAGGLAMIGLGIGVAVTGRKN
jgi:threonine/homoserine/homoserine lactone efflux protein